MRGFRIGGAWALALGACAGTVTPDVVPDDADDTPASADTDAVDGVDSDADTEVPPSPGRPWLNEVQCRGSEWVELAAFGGDVDLGGYRLTDRADGAPSDHDLVLPAGTLLPSGGFLAIDALPFGVDCDGDVVLLLDPAGALVDRVDVAGVFTGQGLGRLPDVLGPWSATLPTPGAPNVAWAPVDATPLFDPTRPFDVAITLSPASVAALAVDPRTYVDAHVTLTAADGTVLFDDAAGARLKGQWGSFRELDGKAAFKLDLDQLVPGGEALGVRKLTLNNMVQDASKIHETLAYTLLGATGVPAPRTGYAHVSVNGADYGLYLHVETVDDTLAPRAFVSTRHLYEGAYGQDLFLDDVPELQVDAGDPLDRADLLRIVDLLEAVPRSEGWDAIAPLVDQDELVAALAGEIWIGHWDGYGPWRNNYTLHLDDQGVVSLLPSGVDQTFASELPLYDAKGRLLRVCLADVDCFGAYVDALERINTTVLATPSLVPGLRALSAALRPRVAADPRLETSMDDYDAGLEATIAFLAARTAGVGEALACARDASLDLDGDGAWCGRDCDETDPTVHRGAVEVCGDGVDQDCTGSDVDEPTCPDCVFATLDDGIEVAACPFPRTWSEGRARCEALGLELATPDDDENEAMWAFAQSVSAQDYWIGLDDHVLEGLFLRPDGLPPTFVAWAPGEPNDYGTGEDCAHFWASSASWNDNACRADKGTLCEAPASP